MFKSIATGILTNVLSNVVYDVGKKGVERCKYSATEKDVIEHLRATYKNANCSQQEIKETLDTLLENQSLMFQMLSDIVSEIGMSTTVHMYNNQIALCVPVGDVLKLPQIRFCKDDSERRKADVEECSLLDAISAMPTEEEMLSLVSAVKEHIVLAVPTTPKSILFQKWFEENCNKPAVFFEVAKPGYYSVSRAAIDKKIKYDPRIYVVDTSNLSNYSCYEAKEIPSLSDCNNIVIKLNTEKGYIVAISGTL